MKSISFKSKIQGLFLIPFILLIFVLILPIIPFLIIGYRFKGYILPRKFVKYWFPQGKRIIFAYSNSPHWKNRIETKIIPKIKDSAIILNWSDHKLWPKSLETEIFFYFRGKPRANIKAVKLSKTKHYIPIAIIFKPDYSYKIIRLWDGYHYLKQGNSHKLDLLEKELFENLT